MNTQSSDQRTYFAVATRGAESAVAAELQSLGIGPIKIFRGGVEFSGTLRDLYRANLELRVASRVLHPLREFAAETTQMLYDQARRIPWERWIRPASTFAVECSIPKSDPRVERELGPDALRHSHFAALKIKDAIADRLREKRGNRPNVDSKRPDLLIVAHVTRHRGTRCVLSMDSSGPSLHERGYRPPGAEAPLKETLAASILALSGWKGDVPLVDPFCGSGTLVVEAAMKALSIAPGLSRRRFAFMSWPDYDANLWDSLLEEAKKSVRDELKVPIFGMDSSGQALTLARASAKAAGVENHLTFKRGSIEELTLEEMPKGILVTNPPYGERLGNEEELIPVYTALGSKLKKDLKGWTAYVLSGNPTLSKHIGLKSSQKFPLYNGPIECRLLKYEMY